MTETTHNIATRDELYVEAAFSFALEAVAAGLAKGETAGFLRVKFEQLTTAELETVLHDARIEAENQGVEREDIDGSWYR